MIQFDFRSTKIKLLYRGTRDGFRAADFHRLCSNKSKTLTIIQTTKGYIFGGYTMAAWTNRSDWYRDQNAFLFSLVNKFNKPFLAKIAEPEYAILGFEKAGPCFGSSLNKRNSLPSSENHDIFVCDQCDQLLNSSSRLNSYKVIGNLSDPDGIYLCDTLRFLVRELEVFQVA